jgi:hypothetical protein
MGMNIKPLPLVLNDANALKLLREIASDSARILFSHHARQRMKQRKVSAQQVYQCLLKGRIDEATHLDMHGSWRCTVERVCAGESVRVAVAMYQNENGQWVSVITVMN